MYNSKEDLNIIEENGIGNPNVDETGTITPPPADIEMDEQGHIPGLTGLA